MDILIDQKTKDLVFNSGDISLVGSQPDLLVQRLFVRFKTFKRELFWNRNFGIDYIRDVYGRSRQKLTVDTIFKNAILEEGMVESIVSFNSKISGYSYSCRFVVKLKKLDQTVTVYLLTNENGIILTDEKGNSLTINF